VKTCRWSIRSVWAVVISGLLLSGSPVGAGSGAKHAPVKITDGTQVSLEYTLSLEDKTVVESTVGGKPMTYQHGAHEIVPGLETALTGLPKGEKKRVVVKPSEGYGAVDPKAVQEVKKSMIPEQARKVGAQLEAKGPDGQSMFPIVTAVNEDTVTLDFNHPLAGKTLIFDVKVLDIRPGEQKKP
jgi:FKBP-type peptidyl-prolyl cis-trans isomerase SlyD